MFGAVNFIKFLPKKEIQLKYNESHIGILHVIVSWALKLLH